MVGLAIMSSPSVSAEGLRIQPLQYRETLQKSEKKTGYVDITNPGEKALTAQFSIKAFRQQDDNGSLGFVDDEQVSKGIRLDMASADLAPKDVLRLYFTIDGAKLPSGDVFAAVFAETKPEGARMGSNVSARVGTLLFLSNGTPSSHSAEIGKLGIDRIQIGEGVTLVASLKNTAQLGQATGFFPKIEARLGPYDVKTVDGPLVFAGHERQVTYRHKGNYFGPLYVSVRTGQSEKSQWIFAVTGYWRWLAPLLLGLVVAIIFCVMFFRRRKRKLSYIS